MKEKQIFNYFKIVKGYLKKKTAKKKLVISAGVTIFFLLLFFGLILIQTKQTAKTKTENRL